MRSNYLVLLFIITFNFSVSAQSWTLIYDNAATEYFNSSAVDPSSNYLYQGITSGASMRRSSDGGATWSLITPNSLPAFSQKRQMFCTNTGTLMVVGINNSTTELYRSTDHGDNFAQITGPGLDKVKVLSNGSIIMFNPASATTDSYISTDDGQTWNYINRFQTTSKYAIDFALSGSTIYAIMNYNSTNGLFKTTDNGSTWIPISGANLPAAGYFERIMNTPNGDLYVYGYAVETAKSTDHGVTWTIPLATKKCTDLYSDANGNLFGSRSSVCERSSDQGLNQVNVIDGLLAPAFGIGAFNSTLSGKVYTADGYGRVFKYTGIGAGITENKFSKNHISLYPNPATNEIHWGNENNNLNISSIYLFDVNGKLIKTETPNSFNNKIDVSKLESGTYFLNFIFKDGSVSNSYFIKQI